MPEKNPGSKGGGEGEDPAIAVLAAMGAMEAAAWLEAAEAAQATAAAGAPSVFSGTPRPDAGDEIPLHCEQRRE